MYYVARDIDGVNHIRGLAEGFSPFDLPTLALG
jgi:hypothetical protein